VTPAGISKINDIQISAPQRSIAMAQYTEDFLAAARSGYENTDQPMRELARELGIGITTLSTLAEKHGWAKRSLRKRGLSPAMQLLAEAQALAGKTSAHSRASGNPESAELGPRLRGDERSESGPHPSRLATLAPQDDGANLAPVEGGGGTTPDAPEPTDLLIKLEQILAQLITAQQLAPANGIHSPQGARNLTLLIQAMRALRGMHPAPTHTEMTADDDDMPADIDEFRLDLARRIDAFVASRTDAADAGGDAGPAPLDAAG
jgi:hypothetical protein